MVLFLGRIPEVWVEGPRTPDPLRVDPRFKLWSSGAIREVSEFPKELQCFPQKVPEAAKAVPGPSA